MNFNKLLLVTSNWDWIEDLLEIAKSATEGTYNAFPLAAWVDSKIPGHAKGKIISLNSSHPDRGETIANLAKLHVDPDGPIKACVLVVEANDWPAQWLSDIAKEFKRVGVAKIVVITNFLNYSNFRNVRGVNIVSSPTGPTELANALGIKV
jgi:hypothetical protein